MAGRSSKTQRAPQDAAPLVIQRRRPPLAAALGGLLALVALTMWWGLSTDSGIGRVVSLVVFGVAGAAAILLGAEVLRAGRPALTADATRVATGPAPSFVLQWEEIARIRVLTGRGWRGPAIGIVPVDLAAVVGRAMTKSRDTSDVAALLRKRESSQGAPIVISLRFTSVDPQEARQQLTALAAGRTPVTD